MHGLLGREGPGDEARRDLENSLLKGRRSRLYKQYTSLKSYYDHSLRNQPYCGAVTVEATHGVLNLYWALCLHVQHSATDCCYIATDYTMHPSKAYKLSINHLHLSLSSCHHSHRHCHCASVPTRLLHCE